MSSVFSATLFAQTALLRASVSESLKNTFTKRCLPLVFGDSDLGEPKNFDPIFAGLLDESDGFVHASLEIKPHGLYLDNAYLYDRVTHYEIEGWQKTLSRQKRGHGEAPRFCFSAPQCIPFTLASVELSSPNFGLGLSI
jgi:hypothetical protein